MISRIMKKIQEETKEQEPKKYIFKNVKVGNYVQIYKGYSAQGIQGTPNMHEAAIFLIIPVKLEKWKNEEVVAI